MNAFKGFFRLILILLFTAAILLPLTTATLPLSGEAWLLQSVRELHQHFTLVPTLNGLELPDKNPLNILLLSAIPSDNIILLRLLNLGCGCLLAAGVFIFCAAVFNVTTATLAALLTATSAGFIMLYGTLNIYAAPLTLALLAYLAFTHAYLRGTHPWRYTLAYLLLGFAGLSGGWITLIFMALAVAALLLLDFAPEKLLNIRIISGLLIIIFMFVIFYLVYRIAGGHNYVSAVLNHPDKNGFLANLWSFVKATMPWLLMLVPAWIYEAKPDNEDHWRDLLPVKIGFSAGLLIMLLGRHHNAAHALFSVPFAAIMTAYWIDNGFKSGEKLLSLRHSAILISGGIAIATLTALLGRGPLLGMAITTPEIILLAVLLVMAVIFTLLARRQHYRTAIITSLTAIIIGTWAYAWLALPYENKGPIKYVETIASNAPIVAFEDDFTMRGLLGYADARPIIVSREIVPVGTAAYLATVTKDSEKLNESLNKRMLSKIESSYGKKPAYVLYFIETEVLQ